jgi:GNAT superfamily N-acetyltransferase
MDSDLPEIVVSEAPGSAECQAIMGRLIEYNESKGFRTGFEPLAILLRHPNTGETVGGIWGKSSYDWLYLEFFFVPEVYRGRDIGTLLLQKAEEVARARGCIGLWLSTFAFQAPGFYERNGFECFGTPDDRPSGSKFHMMKKLLA